MGIVQRFKGMFWKRPETPARIATYSAITIGRGRDIQRPLFQNDIIDVSVSVEAQNARGATVLWVETADVTLRAFGEDRFAVLRDVTRPKLLHVPGSSFGRIGKFLRLQMQTPFGFVLKSGAYELSFHAATVTQEHDKSIRLNAPVHVTQVIEVKV